MERLKDVTVFLSTTKFLTSHSDPEIFQKFIAGNLPICVVRSYLSLDDLKGRELEKKESEIAIRCKAIAEYVNIDSDKKSLAVGNQKESLFSYTHEITEKYSQEFFIQWDLLHILVFEFQVLDNKKNIIFTLRGIWERDHWRELDVFYFERISVITDDLS
jgi:hypothetical protein